MTTQQHKVTQSGDFEYEPEAGSGDRYIRLAKEGDQAVMRIVTTKVHGVQHWLMDAKGKSKPKFCIGPSGKERTAWNKNEKVKQTATPTYVPVPMPNPCPYCGDGIAIDEKVEGKEQFIWGVIDRADGKVKVYKAPKSVYWKLKKKNKSEDWGDPCGYDIRVLRTLASNGFTDYDLDGIPQSFGPITDAEKAEIVKAKLDLVGELKGTIKKKAAKQGYDKDLETAPTAVATSPITPATSVSPAPTPETVAPIVADTGAKALNEQEEVVGDLPF